MHPQMEMIPCAIVRGGTSKGIFLKEVDLPSDPERRDAVIRAVFGSPDLRQIDGLGGADVLTSKLAIIGPSSRADCDIDYTFGQVSFETAFIDYRGNCGNISAAVGGFAIDEGMVRAVEPMTTVRIHLTNCGRVLTAEVPVVGGRAAVDGDFVIDGCPGSGARVTLDWSDVTGSITGRLLPTGNLKDTLEVDGRKYTVSIVDAGNPLVFVHAASIGMVGTESPAEIEGNGALMALIERMRGRAAVLCGLVERPEEASTRSPYNPFFAIVSEPAPYLAINGKEIAAGDVDLVSRLLFMLRMHKTYPITGTVCTGAACRIPGTVAWEVLGERGRSAPSILIGHPSGVVPVEAKGGVVDGVPKIERLGVYRTARRIMDGYAYVRKGVF
ncbi:MAG: hypothetical protein LBR22_01470 [Desulfovibrio sp.]|jgi:2-methylaconitate cis-trans-isomerase PrpF|nr:hypothetical protein [Desulfovibrio sp.]